MTFDDWALGMIALSIILILLTLMYPLVFSESRVEYRLIIVNETSIINDFENKSVNGFYSYKGYFVVLTKGRSPDSIARTTFHELTHYYNDENTNHFLGLLLK